MSDTAKKRILKYLCEHGRTPLWTLREPDIGGSSADSTMRKLRIENGIPIKWEYRTNKDGEKLGGTDYWLDCDPGLIDIENLCVRAPVFVQSEMDLVDDIKIEMCPVCGGVIGRYGIDGCLCNE